MNNNGKTMKWDSAFYQDKHGFVAEYGKELLKYIFDSAPGHILDIGCGTGTLTGIMSGLGHQVTGIDASPDMVLNARNHHPAIDFLVMDACDIPWENTFDIVFSNAVFHWISNQKKLLSSIYRALKPGGKLIAEMGASGNIERIQKAFEATSRQYGYQYQSPFFFPSSTEYGSMLEHAGFHVIFLEEFDRPTPLEEAGDGLKNWIRQFFANDLEHFTPEICNAIIRHVEETLKGKLWNGTRWIADYRRLRIIAEKPVP